MISGWNLKQFHFSLLKYVIDEMMIYADVLGLGMLYLILYHMNGTGVVTTDGCLREV